MKKLRWSDLSLVSKIVIEVGVLAALMFTINMLFYVRINNSMQEMDDVYASNAQITELGQVFEDVQDSMYQYLKVKRFPGTDGLLPERSQIQAGTGKAQ